MNELKERERDRMKYGEDRKRKNRLRVGVTQCAKYVRGNWTGLNMIM
jgi:hypothetical protein